MKMKQKEMLKRGLIIIPVVCAVIAVVFLKGAKKGPKQLPVKETVHRVRTLEIQPVDVVPRALGYGYVEPDRVWQVAPEVSGKIIRTSRVFGKGNFVRKGDLLISLDPTNYELAVREVGAEVRGTRAKLAELERTEENTKRLLEIQQSLLLLKQKELKRNETARKTRAVSESALDRARVDCRVQQIQVQDLKNALNLIPTTRQALEAQLDLGLAKLDEARKNLARTSIHVPFNCRLTEIRAEVGQFVQAGQILAEADGTDRVEITAQVPMEKMRRLFLSVEDSDIAEKFNPAGIMKMDRLKKILGLKVKVSLVNNGFDATWDADFARADATIDPQTRTVGIIVVVEKPYEQIIMGVRPPLVRNLFCEVEISGKFLEERVVIPRSALHQNKVYVVDAENRLARVPVQVEFAQEDFYMLKTGLAQGRRIVVSDLMSAMDGMLLEYFDDQELEKRLISQAGNHTN